MVVKTITRKAKVLELSEKAVSRAQQKFFGMVRAAHKGELKNPSQEVADVADNISVKDAKDIASTKHNKLPEKKVTEDAGYDFGKGWNAKVHLGGNKKSVEVNYKNTNIFKRTKEKSFKGRSPKVALDQALIGLKNQDDPAKNLPGMNKEETIWERLSKGGYVMSDRETREDDAEKARKERDLRMRYGKRWRDFTDEAKEKKKKEEEILARYKEKKEKGIAFSDKYGTGYIKDGKKKYNYRKKR